MENWYSEFTQADVSSVNTWPDRCLHPQHVDKSGSQVCKAEPDPGRKEVT